MTGTARTVALEGLSCYTANLAAYLAVEWDAAALVARSVRLAVRPGGATGHLAFSHHDPALDRLPDGTRLRYEAAPSPAGALAAVAGELERFGRALVVVDTARLPWSPARGGRPAPHWLLVDGRDGDRWHVVDAFAGRLLAGEQRPYEGWVGSGRLRGALTLPASWRPEQRLRNGLAFGAPVGVPEPAPALLLRRRTGGSPAGEAGGATPGDGWVVGDREALPLLADHLAERGADALPCLEDVWAAAGHRAFAYRWRAARGDGAPEPLARAVERWEDLSRVLRVALESAGRGRPRPTLVRLAFEELLRAEEDVR